MSRLVALFCAAALHAAPLPAAEPLRVLFVGNSYTYFNNAPEVFAALARTALPGREVRTGMVAVPGETLLALWERSPARREVRSSKWDYVVLQDQSLLGEGLRDGRFTVNSPRLLHWGVRLFDGEIRRAGARTVVMQTWSRRAEPGHQADLDHAYDSVARELGATLAPVGRIWARARREYPGMDLYAADGSHPSAAGSYLLACTLLFALIPDADGVLPSSVSGHPVSGAGVVDTRRHAVLVALPAEQAMQLQSLARSATAEIKRQGGYLDAHPPERTAASLPSGQPLRGDRLAGTWSGELTYLPAPATLELTLTFDGDDCHGDAAIYVPDRRQRFDAPLASCTIAADTLTFSVVTLPLPFLTDRFVGRLVEGRLVGTVERTGRELTNSMSGTWTLRRKQPPRQSHGWKSDLGSSSIERHLW